MHVNYDRRSFKRTFIHSILGNSTWVYVCRLPSTRELSFSIKPGSSWSEQILSSFLCMFPLLATISIDCKQFSGNISCYSTHIDSDWFPCCSSFQLHTTVSMLLAIEKFRVLDVVDESSKASLNVIIDGWRSEAIEVTKFWAQLTAGAWVV